MRKLILSLILIFFVFFPINYAGGAHEPELPETAGLTPDSPVYFLDKFFEDVRLFFAFNPEVKARLHVDFAAERMAEIEAMIEKDSIGAEGIEVAMDRIVDHIQKADDLVQERKEGGHEIASLVESISDNFDSERRDLKEKLNERETNLREEFRDMTETIDVLLGEGDFDRIDDIMKDLKRVGKELRLLDVSLRSMNKEIERHLESIDEELLIEKRARKKIEEAQERYQDLRKESDEENLSVPSGTFMTLEYRSLIEQAKTSLRNSNFEEAIEFARGADMSLNRLEKIVEEGKERTEGETIAVREFKKAEVFFEKALNKAQEEEISIPQSTVNGYNRLISQSRAELEANNFAEAEALAEEASKLIRSLDGLFEEDKTEKIKTEAREEIDEAKWKLKEVAWEARGMSVETTDSMLSEYQGLIDRADEAFDNESYKEAVVLAEEAKNALERLEVEVMNL